MNQDELTQFLQQNFYYLIAGGVIIGLLLGAVPFFLSRKRGKSKLGIAALILSAIAGGVSPVLALIVAAVFLILILKKPAANAAPATNDNLAK